MVSSQGDGERPRITASLPINHKHALDYVASERSQPGNRTYTADVVREAIEEWLYHHSDELPEEARELLDQDRIDEGGDDS